jgi:hypothetical protein
VSGNARFARSGPIPVKVIHRPLDRDGLVKATVVGDPATSGYRVAYRGNIEQAIAALEAGRETPVGNSPFRKRTGDHIMKPYEPVPVEAARAIAEKYGKSIVIIFAHDPVHGVLHTTTYGTDPQNKEWAAKGGEIGTKALGALREAATDFEDYRLEQARALLSALTAEEHAEYHRHGKLTFAAKYALDVEGTVERLNAEWSAGRKR